MKDFKGKKVVVLGLGSSGFFSAKLLKSKGADVFVSENNPGDKQKKYASELKKLNLNFELGSHTQNTIESADCIVLSPGVPFDCQPVKWARNKDIEIIGEIELGYQYCQGQIVAITGTNGKTTVTTLIGRVLEQAGKNVHILGNIGEPFTSRVEKINKGDFVSLEVSSFQLETIKEFRPRVSLILNLTPDHLDRYASVEDYLGAKKRIFMNQKRDDYLILNYADVRLKALADETEARVHFFGAGRSGFAEEKFNPNQLAVIKVAQLLGIDLDVCLEVFKNFKGIEHRMEFVRDINGIEFVNDSKATNVESTIWALKNSVKPVILIAGGRDKGSDFSVISELLRQRVKSLILFGEAKPKIKKALSAAVKISEARDIQEAVDMSFGQAREGDCVLLSPMCASFDMFSNYEERGRMFKDIVLGIKAV